MKKYKFEVCYLSYTYHKLEIIFEMSKLNLHSIIIKYNINRFASIFVREI